MRIPGHTSMPDFDMPNEEQVHLAAESFRLLSDPTRIKILWALLQGESSVACLAKLADATPTAVSRHLAKLRLAGLVKGRREGTFVYYSAADEHVRHLLTSSPLSDVSVASHQSSRSVPPPGRPTCA